ncbi:MAG: hypothetical protein NTY99_00200 [DPANN group archaeon]|nr:hypothetical protein [DPANN group archaeon]
MGIIEPKTWGWIKVLGGLVAFWWTWKAGIGMNLNGAVAILAVLALIGGLNYAMGKK